MNKPKIRFKGFEGEWKEKALGDVVDEFKYGINAAAVSYDGENKYLRITDIDEGSRAFIKDELASPDADLSSCNEYIMQDGDIVIARTGASVGKSYIYRPIDGKVYFAGFLIRARVNKNVDREFVFQNTLTDGFKKYIRFVSQRSGQPGVNAEELKSYLMSLPASLPEQRAIASYFTSLDAQIAASTSRLSSLKQIKAASLLNMFPQKGEMVPRVRFKGFQGKWKERKLGEVCLVNRGVRITRKDLSNAEGYPVFQNTNYPLGFYQYYNVEAKNPFVIIGGSAGLIGFSNKEFWAADDCVYFKDKEETDKSFLYNILCSHEAEIKKEVRGSSVPRLDRSILEKLRINLPSLPEQRAIASYFTTLDAQITLHRKRLEKLKQIKAACLKKMIA